MTKKETKELVVQQNDVVTWDNEKWQSIKNMFIPSGVSDSDATLFIELAKAYNLNPFKREIWVVPYGNKANVFVGRDGYLSIAHKSGMLDGMETTFGYDSKGILLYAETKVYNKSMAHPIVHRAYLKEYTTGRNLWQISLML